MAKAVGVGGVFLRAKDPEALYQWYARNLGVERMPDGSFAFDGPSSFGMTVFAFFPSDTKYFGPSGQAAMLNFRVDDLTAVLASLRAAGATVDEKREDHDYGSFGWFDDPEGNRVELWQPPKS